MTRRPVERLSEHVWRVELPCDTLPPYDHVNAYIVAKGGVGVVIDPGSDRPEADALLASALAAADVRLVKGVLLTHTHPDHLGGVPSLLRSEASRTGSSPPVYAHAAEAAELPGEWQATFLADGRVLTVGDVDVRAMHTPGHSHGHLSFAVTKAGNASPEAIVVGDLASASGSVWVGLPEGDVGDYLTSLERLAALGAPVLGAGHGPAITAPTARLRELAEHRLAREAQILAALELGPADAMEITRRVYPDHPESVLAFAEKSVLAHVAKLMRELRVVHLGSDERGPFAVRR